MFEVPNSTYVCVDIHVYMYVYRINEILLQF